MGLMRARFKTLPPPVPSLQHEAAPRHAPHPIGGGARGGSCRPNYTRPRWAALSRPYGRLPRVQGAASGLADQAGSPILAPAAGTVVAVEPLDVRGNVTIIDHGWGVFTVYCHQTEQYVAVGDMVTARQVIGLTGATGRVTGSHLHWELWIDGVPVDPMQWVRESFSN